MPACVPKEVRHRRESSRTEPSLHFGGRSRPSACREVRRRRRLRPPNAWTKHPRDFQPDPETGVAPGFTRCRNMRSRCRCSMCPAIHINSRSWLRSSSTHEPSDPPLRVVSRRQAATVSFQQPRGSGSGREPNDPHRVYIETVARKNNRSSGAARPFEPPGGISHTAGPAL